MKARLIKDLKVDRYTLTHLAAEAGIHRSYLSTILNGKILPSIRTATCLALAASRMTGKDYTPDMFLTIAAKEINNG